MGVRKNAKFLTASERQDFVRACVLLKAHIVNPGAPAAQQYSKWDEYVAIHQMIQNAFAPGAPNVNFGHGGSGAYGFLSWHRFLLVRFEADLQAKVAGVMLPYWDWSDPAPLMVDDFLGPNGSVSDEVRRGWFAVDAPGTGTNPTPAPAWWPAGLVGWRLPASFGTSAGALKRAVGAVASLPPSSNISQTLAKATYAEFQLALESGAGLIGATAMHNGMHTWFGTVSHMRNAQSSPFDPIFFLHHCNVDRLWAMWQADGHAADYPVSGGSAQHHRNDLMYPWVGGAAGYGTRASIATAIPMPDFSALGARRNVDTLDHRGAFGYTYDSIVVLGLGLDRTGSMLGLTPDPMTVAAPDVTKWEAARRGVSAFLQDCETVQASGSIYTVVGIKTFRRLAANDFQPVFAGAGHGVVKAGSSVSRAAFETAVAAMSPGGATPLADALLDVRNTMVAGPFGGLPADEPRYLAMLTDGMSTAGTPLSGIPDASLAPTAVFAMGFGTGLDVDYPTLQGLVDKGRVLSTQQLFHGETAGTIDKFYSNALATALGFTAVFDPVIELFEGEHTHLDFFATSADDRLFLTAQGMDFDDGHWSFHLRSPDGTTLYDDTGADHGLAHGGVNHAGRLARVTSRRGAGRLSLLLERDGADGAAWTGAWQLLVAYRARRLDAMTMFAVDSLMTPVAAGTLRGPRYARLLVPPRSRMAQRNLPSSGHPLDIDPTGTNRNENGACALVLNVYAHSRLRQELAPDVRQAVPGQPVAVRLQTEATHGQVVLDRAFARQVSPLHDIAALRERLNPRQTDPDRIDRKRGTPLFDAALALARAERQDPACVRHDDRMLAVSQHGEGGPHLHLDPPAVAGPLHLSLYVEGEYVPQQSGLADIAHEHGKGAGADRLQPGAPAPRGEFFARLFTTLIPVVPPQDAAATEPGKAQAPRPA